LIDTDGTTQASGDATPGSWRAAALAALGGGVLIGYRAAAGGGLSRLIVAGGTLATIASAAAVAAASRRGGPVVLESSDGPSSGDPPSRTTFSVVVAARDEVEVLPRLVRDLAAQDHRTADGKPLFELILVDDRSTDGTAQAALRAAAAGGLSQATRSIRRGGHDLPDGKGAALTAAQPDDCHGDVVVVLDADARVGPGFLARLARHFDAGLDAVTPRRRVLDATSSWLAAAQADEQTADAEIQRGRWLLGGLSEFRGNGIAVRRNLLASVGGWRAEALTEDLDLSSRIAAETGMAVAHATDVEVWEEPVQSWDALWRQRVRWAEGAIVRALEHGPAVLRSSRVAPAAKADFAGYVGQLALGPVIAGALLRSWRTGRGGTARVLLCAYGAVGAALAYDALRWETDRGGAPLLRTERLRRAVRAAAFGGIWLAAVPAAMWRLAMREGPIAYDKMEHGRGS
jgi:glycosyltransferase involved in cell wall biosynthesis